MAKQRNSGTSFLILLIVFAVGGILGNLIGEFFGDYLPLLNMSREVGLSSPLELDLNFIYLQFGLLVRLNLAGVLGLLLAIWLFRRL
ncbi:DUF4321 domain-containing protein [Natranaerobius trueperi]|uniref:DUF4321 domain-containing protein n=1 Tax=Natranaerobius trueperi TaxID=759412 RepID=A0A226BZZ3_9FIRM|nr:DUF4321 domain-containing protein [Natranaerobius trueperi]OWZ83914.1 hypothetical protein CDO51_05875 [Natranaerobius trueperi]